VIFILILQNVDKASTNYLCTLEMNRLKSLF